MDKGGQRWTKVDKDGQGWTKMDKDGQRWTKMDKDGQRWTKRYFGMIQECVEFAQGHTYKVKGTKDDGMFALRFLL